MPSDAEAIATAVASVPGVVRLAAGTSDGVATHLPGHRINGVRVRGNRATIHVVSRFPDGPLAELADSVRAAVRHQQPEAVCIDVRIVDVEDLPPPGAQTPHDHQDQS